MPNLPAILRRRDAGAIPALPETRAGGTDNPCLAGAPARRTVLWWNLVALPAGAAALAPSSIEAAPIAAMRREVLRLTAFYRDLSTSDAEADAALDLAFAIKERIAAGVDVCSKVEAICAPQWAVAKAHADMPNTDLVDTLLASALALLRAVLASLVEADRRIAEAADRVLTAAGLPSETR